MPEKDELLQLYDLAEKEGVIVKDFDIGVDKSMIIHNEDFCAIGLDNSKGRMSKEEELCCLAHEMGHQQTGGYYNDELTEAGRRKKEYKAIKWQTNRLLDFENIQALVNRGVTNSCEIADELGITEDFLTKAVNYYERRGKRIKRYRWDIP